MRASAPTAQSLLMDSTTAVSYTHLDVYKRQVRGIREFFYENEFTEIHSPKIVAAGAEGGANIFQLDYFGKKAFLAQSPQFYKQTMVGVYERVFEIGPVFRAEKHSTSCLLYTSRCV